MSLTHISIGIFKRKVVLILAQYKSCCFLWQHKISTISLKHENQMLHMTTISLFVLNAYKLCTLLILRMRTPDPNVWEMHGKCMGSCLVIFCIVLWIDHNVVFILSDSPCDFGRFYNRLEMCALPHLLERFVFSKPFSFV